MPTRNKPPLPLKAFSNAVLLYGMHAGIFGAMKGSRKVTVILPEALLAKAQQSTGEGLTPTIRRGLELLAADKAYRRLKSLKGKVTFSLDVAALRED